MNIQFADSNRLLFTILTTLLLFIILKTFFYSIKMQGIFAFVLINIFSFCNILLIHFSKKRLSNLYQNKKFYLVNFFCFLFLIIFIIIKIDYSIYYKWNPEKKILYNSYLLHFITFLILVIFFYLLKKGLLETNKTLKKIFFLIGIFFCAHISSYQIINENHIYFTNPIHFETVYYPIVQLYYGKVILTDFFSQYGLYPLFFVPILKFVGLNILSITSLFAFLLFLSLLILQICVWKIIKNYLLATITFIGAVYFLFSPLNYPIFLNYAIYPIRLFFPFLSFYFIILYIQNQKNLYFYLLILSLGTFFNPDSGIPSLFAFLAIVFIKKIMSENYKKKIIKFSIKFIIIYFFSILFFQSLVYFFYKKTVDLNKLFETINMFGGFGPSITEFKFFKISTFAIIVYIISIFDFFKRDRQSGEYISLYLTIVGVSLFFRQFINHSENAVLYITWPAYIIIALIIDKKLKTLPTQETIKNNLIINIFNKNINYFLIIILNYLIIFNCLFFVIMTFTGHYKDSIRLHEFYLNRENNNKIVWWYGLNGLEETKYMSLKNLQSTDILPPWISRKNQLLDFNTNNIIKNKIAIFSEWDAYLHMHIKLPSELNIINTEHIFLIRSALEEVDHKISNKKLDFIILDTSANIIDRLTVNNHYHKNLPNINLVNSIEKNYFLIKKLEVTPTYNFNKKKWEKNYLLIYAKSN